MSNALKWTLLVVMTAVIFAAIAFPIAATPATWYEYPDIPGLGQNAKIIFFHVPTAWLTVVAFFMATFYGYRYLKNKRLEDDVRSLVSLRLGMMFCLLATVTGMVWAKFAWGAFWHWDPRETSIFALLLVYGALFALRSAIEDEERRASLSAAYSILAFVTVPFFIFVMPRVMAGLHPGSGDEASSGPVVNFQMSGNMFVVFFSSLAAFTLLYRWMWNVAARVALLRRRRAERLYYGEPK
ncbi:MAG: ABC transporter permease [Ignavibacteriales bacterium]|jgi:heme exporter protein C|nr:ABC transporter permease [Ignavibacteriales bacterium]